MNIYQPYFYIIQEKSTGMYYAGAKWANDATPNNFMTENGYCTSSKIINYIIEAKGLSEFIIRKIRVFKTSKETYEYETKFLKKVKAKSNPKFLNGHENDWLMPDNTNRVSVKDCNGNNFKVDVLNPRYLSGELVHNTKGKVVVKDRCGNSMQVDVLDPRYLSGELVHISKEMVTVIDAINGCRSRVSIEQFKESDNLVGICNGKIPVVDQHGHKFSVEKTDSRFRTGEIRHVTKGMVTVKSATGETLSVPVDDPRYMSGELIHNTKRKISVKDAYGNTMQVDKNDPRYISGELVGVTKGIKRPSKKVKCPHCNKLGGISQMKRWHFDKCKKLR